MKTSVKTTLKLSAEERRASIIKGVRRVFAEKGFHGTTTRALAEAAGVSEALLFKHFPNKEALYSAMQVSCCNDQDSGLIERLKRREPSTSTLVALVHLIVSNAVGKRVTGEDEGALQLRLMLRSLTEDGEFARHLLSGAPAEGNQWIEACLKGAVAAGDAVAAPFRPNLGGWFANHLAVMLMVHLLPKKPVIDYGVSREKLVEQTVWFILRGMGLKDEAIKREYNPKGLARFAEP